MTTIPNSVKRNAIIAVRDARGLPPAEKHVAIGLAMRSTWATGEDAWPDLETLAADSGVSVSTAKRGLAGLQRRGLIRHTADRPAMRGGRPVKVWALDLDAFYALHEGHQEQSEEAAQQVTMTGCNRSPRPMTFPVTRPEGKEGNAAAAADPAFTPFPAAMTTLSDDMREWAAEHAPSIDLDAKHAQWLTEQTTDPRRDWTDWWQGFMRNAEAYAQQQTAWQARRARAAAQPAKSRKRRKGDIDWDRAFKNAEQIDAVLGAAEAHGIKPTGLDMFNLVMRDVAPTGRGHDDLATWGEPETDPNAGVLSDAEIDAIFGPEVVPGEVVHR